MQVNSVSYNPSFNGTVTTPSFPSAKYEKAVYPYIQKLTNTKYDFCITEELSKICGKYLNLTVLDNGKTIFSKKSLPTQSYQKVIADMFSKLKIQG